VLCCQITRPVFELAFVEYSNSVWWHRVPAIVLSAREAHVSNHTDQTAARDQRPGTVAPHLIELGEEILVVLNVAIWPSESLYSFRVQYGGEVTTR
jgi:hypothetical protein